MDIIDILSFGTKVMAHGEEWLRVHPVGIDCYLAIKAEEKELPCPVYLIRPEKKNAS